MRWTLIGAILVLYALSIPWYRANDAPLRIVMGLPDWVAVALLCYVGVAVLNSIAWLLTEVRDDAELPATLRRGEPPSRGDGGSDGGAGS
jgi:hypothetical protein